MPIRGPPDNGEKGDAKVVQPFNTINWPCRDRRLQEDNEKSERTTLTNGRRNLYQICNHWPTAVKRGDDWWTAHDKGTPTTSPGVK